MARAGEIDVVVLGATGVTGRRAAAYLNDRASEVGASWAVAGRDPAKLESVLAEVGVIDPETIHADIGDAASLEAMASRAKVVLNLAGPYTKLGRPVIDACIAGGAHYADLTGELPFVRRVTTACDRPALEAGVKIVQVCGFEALPPDLAVALAAEAAEEPLTEVDVDVEITRQPPGRPRGGDMLSGGTIQSMVEITADEDAASVTDPATLMDSTAAAEEVRRVSPISVAPRREGDRVIAPMVPAAYLNPAVIHRAAELRASESGTPFSAFRYREGLVIGGGRASLVPRMAAAGALAGMQIGLGALTRAPARVREPFARGARVVLPGSGFGPDPDRLSAWEWRMDIHGRTAGGREVGVEVIGQGHPGYLTTATMLGEAGLLMADGETTPQRFGCVTPATALGTASADRFERAGLRFTVSG